MKHLLLIPLGLCLAAVSCQAAPKQTSKVPLVQNVSASKIAQVKVGTLKTAKASWWGFNKADATEALQNAINSKVPTLIVDNMGSDWIVNNTINLVSNQKIIFEDGVVIQAMKDKFKGGSDSLFMGRNVHDLTLEGQGHAVLCMQKADYDNPKIYTRAEWRNGIALYDSRNVTMRNFTVTKTGGDGLYLGATSDGYNENTLVENMNFDDNYRQGISVISAQNLTIRNCRMTNTSGTGPAAGIDFEPNEAGQRLVNCVVEDCVLADNQGAGVFIFPIRLRGSSEPASISIKNCIIKGNSIGLSSTLTNSANNPLHGKVTFTNCTFDHQKILLSNPLVNSAHYLFKNCTLDFRSYKSSLSAENAPIVLGINVDMEKPFVGGVTFENTTVVADSHIMPVAVNVSKSAGLSYSPLLSSQILGSLFLKTHDKTTIVDLKSFLATNRLQLQRSNTIDALKQKYSEVSIDSISKRWRFLTDPATGKDVTSPQFDDSSWKVIDGGVRQWWQKQGFPNYHGVAWYRKEITGTQLSNGQKVSIYFNGVDGNTKVYVNGKMVGEHVLGKDYSGWDQPFHFDITNEFHAGKNVVAVQVTSKNKNTASGINQSVYLVVGTP